MRSALATRGKADVKLAWSCQLFFNNFPMHRFTDTFDDVIETAVDRRDR